MAKCWLAMADGPEPVKYKRALPPAHYSWKIESFSVLSSLNNYDSGVFEAGNYNWRLSLYPKGNKGDNGLGYISLYLSIEEPFPGPVVHVNYKLFVKLGREYLTIQDADGAGSSFHRWKRQCGFPRFLSLKEFKKNGYLKDDSCTFGAEVLVIQPSQPKEESLTLTRYPPEDHTYRWKIENWSTLDTPRRSEEFRLQGRKWKLLVDPRGNAARTQKSLSVYLELQGPTKERRVYTKFTLRVLNNLKPSNNKEKTINRWLCDSDPKGGAANFMRLTDLQNPAKGIVYNDALIVEVQILVILAEPSQPQPSQPQLSQPHGL